MYVITASILFFVFFFLMIRRPPRSTLDRSSAASDVYKRQVLFQPLGELLVGGFLHETAGRYVAELGLGLALELGVAQLHRDDRCDSLTDVFAEQVLVLLLE